jgi:oxygen-independent coproporphyrinogen-3 oxidase
MPLYHDALKAHIKEFAPRLEAFYADTVYIGGGTPTRYGADRLIDLFELLKHRCKVLIDSEVTLEANPESVRLDDFKALRKAGFNRVSLGAQSFNDAHLRRIDRAHNREEILDAIEHIRAAGFDNLSLDLIYGLPGQTRKDWAEDLAQAMRLQPEHISAYGLKIERGTKLWPKRGDPDIPDDDTQADMYLYTVDALAGDGYAQYEISNFAKPGRESKHNLKYWTLKPYVGFGSSASSYFGNIRYKYLIEPESYIAATQNNAAITIPDETEYLSPYEHAADYIMLGMRTSAGICRSEYNAIYRGGFDSIENTLQNFVKLELTIRREDRYSFTPRGFLLSNRLIGELLDAQAERKMQAGTPWRANDYFN